jgi:hypothetical protein
MRVWRCCVGSLQAVGVLSSGGGRCCGILLYITSLLHDDAFLSFPCGNIHRLTLCLAQNGLQDILWAVHAMHLCIDACW